MAVEALTQAHVHCMRNERITGHSAFGRAVRGITAIRALNVYIAKNRLPRSDQQ
jgi:hypothetical protein